VKLAMRWIALPQASVAMKATWAVAQVIPGVLIVSVDSVTAPQLSAAEAPAYPVSQIANSSSTSAHPTVMSAGSTIHSGASWSSTRITCAAIAVLPQASEAVQMRVIVRSHGG